MADRAVSFRHEILKASDMPVNPPCCPKCKGQDLRLTGQLAFPHTEIWQAGKVVDSSTDFDVEFQFELSTVECMRCKVIFDIQGDREFTLSTRVSELREEIREITGTDPYGEPKPC